MSGTEFGAAADGGEKRYDFKTISVFIGSSKGFYPGTEQQDPIYEEQARTLGTALAHQGYSMVYGGGSAGLMGVVSETYLTEGGSSLTGVVMPVFAEESDYLQKTHPKAKEVVVDGIETRKWEMLTNSDAFFVFPGGMGSLDELTEAAVEQYQRPYRGKNNVSKPIIVLNIEGFYDDTRRQMETMISRGFLKQSIYNVIHFVPDVTAGLELLAKLNGQPRLSFEKIGNVCGSADFAQPKTPDAM